MYLYCNSTYADCAVHLVSEPFGESLCKSGSFVPTQSNCGLFLYDARDVFQYINHITDELHDIYSKSRQYTLLCTLYLAFTRIYTRSIHLFLVVQMATLAFPFFHCWRYGMLRYFLRHPLFRYFS